MADAVTTRRTVTMMVLSALFGAAAGVAVTTHPFTDEGDRGPQLLGDHHATPPGHQKHQEHPGMSREHARPGWSHGDKDGWHGQDVPPGWLKHHVSGPESDSMDSHDESDHGKGPKKDHEHDR